MANTETLDSHMRYRKYPNRRTHVCTCRPAHARTHAHKHTHTKILAHIHTHTKMLGHICTGSRTYTQARENTYTQYHAYTHCSQGIETHVRVFISAHTHMHAYVQTHTLAHAGTHKLLLLSPRRGDAAQWAASLDGLVSPPHSERDHATEQLHAHLQQAAGARGLGEGKQTRL